MNAGIESLSCQGWREMISPCSVRHASMSFMTKGFLKIAELLARSLILVVDLYDHNLPPDGADFSGSLRHTARGGQEGEKKRTSIFFFSSSSHRRGIF